MRYGSRLCLRLNWHYCFLQSEDELCRRANKDKKSKLKLGMSLLSINPRGSYIYGFSDTEAHFPVSDQSILSLSRARSQRTFTMDSHPCPMLQCTKLSHRDPYTSYGAALPLAPSNFSGKYEICTTWVQRGFAEPANSTLTPSRIEEMYHSHCLWHSMENHAERISQEINYQAGK